MEQQHQPELGIGAYDPLTDDNDSGAAFISDSLTFLCNARKQRAGAIWTRMGVESVLVLNDPVFVAQVLSDQHERFDKILGFRRAREFISPGLFRRDLPWSTTGRYSETPRVVDRLINVLITSATAGQTVLLYDLLKTFSFSLICELVCGIKLAEEEVLPLRKDLDGVIDLLNQQTLTFPVKAAPPGIETMQAFQRAIDRLDLHLMYAIDGGNSRIGIGRDLGYTALLAGYEQIAAILFSALCFLSTNEKWQELLVAQPTSGEEAKNEAEATVAVLNETMRLSPPVWMIGRRAKSSIEILGINIPEGAVAIASQYAIQRSPDVFHSPHEFDPERWKAWPVDDVPPFYFFPFGHGIRACKGEQFVRICCQLTLPHLVRRMRVSAFAPFRYEAKITLHPPDCATAFCEHR